VPWLKYILPDHGKSEMLRRAPFETGICSRVGSYRKFRKGADIAVREVEIEPFTQVKAGLHNRLVART
jgi:hypothetical protein